jgi:hypothetical protein
MVEPTASDWLQEKQSSFCGVFEKKSELIWVAGRREG